MFGVAELFAAIVPGARSLVIAVGDEVIDRTPGWLERAVIQNLGTSDKPFLIANILVVSALLGAATRHPRRAAIRRRRSGDRADGGGRHRGLVPRSADRRPGAALGRPRRRCGRHRDALASAAGGSGDLGTARSCRRGRSRPPTLSRSRRRRRARRGAAARSAAGCSRTAAASTRSARRSACRDPSAGRRRAATGRESSGSRAQRRSSSRTADFYRIDTALVVPQVDRTAGSSRSRAGSTTRWSISYDELMAMPQIEADVTLSCVSNQVGGELVGNARWQGVPLPTLLERGGRAGRRRRRSSAARSTASRPASRRGIAIDGRDRAWSRSAMNGEPLPIKHGFPARLVVPGLYGYVSATKWLSSIELTRGTSSTATGSRVAGRSSARSRRSPASTCRSTRDRRRDADDRRRGLGADPRHRARRGADRRRALAGATLAAALGDNTWVQWLLRWQAKPGNHTIAVRATDDTGYTQTAEQTDVAPNGATGHHTIRVTVE